jgi:Na+-driven multidrug efflux pump
MNNLGKNILPMIAFTFAIVLHPLWVYIFMVKFDLELYGIGIAATITNLFAYGMMQYLLLSQKDI